MSKVFISYSWDSIAHQDAIYQLSNRLRADGIDCDIDQYHPFPEQGWPKWMEQQLRNANYVLVVCTETYLNRFEGREEANKGQGVKWESLLTTNQIYRQDSLNQKFIPIILATNCQPFIPQPLDAFSHFDLSQDEGYLSLYRYLTNQPQRPKPELGTEQRLDPDAIATLPSKQRVWQDQALKIQVTKLPHTNSQLFGREGELALLDQAWQGNNTNILTIKAVGGTGKTALMQTWLNQLAAEHYWGAQAVYTFSFYSQGAAEDKQASADGFFDEALKWFGYQGEPIPSAHDKGLALAELINRQRTLLILDGLEPMQYPLGGAMDGALRDQGLKSLCLQLAAHNSGLLLISSRQPVQELAGHRPPLVQQSSPGTAIHCRRYRLIQSREYHRQRSGTANHSDRV